MRVLFRDLIPLFCKKMKTLLTLMSCSALLFTTLSAEEPPKVAWQGMDPAKLREHVEQVKNFREIQKLLGRPTSTDNNGTWSSSRYRLKNSLTLVFSGEPKNDFRKDDDLRHVSSIYLFKNDAAGHKVVWKLFKKPVAEGGFRSDHLDLPSSKIDSQNKTCMATPTSPSVFNVPT